MMTDIIKKKWTKYYTITVLFILVFMLCVLLLCFIQGRGEIFGMDTAEKRHFKYSQILEFQLRVDKQIADKTMLFFGDSLVHGMAVSSVGFMSVNFGIGGDTSQDLLERLPLYESVKKAGAIIFLIGINDIKISNDENVSRNISNALKIIPSDIPVVLIGLIPVSEEYSMRGLNNRISRVNKELLLLREGFENLQFFDIGKSLVDINGDLDARYHIGDGLHLNEVAYLIILDELRTKLNKVIL